MAETTPASFVVTGTAAVALSTGLETGSEEVVFSTDSYTDSTGMELYIASRSAAKSCSTARRLRVRG